MASQLKKLEDYLQEIVSPIAHLLDGDSKKLNEIFAELKTMGLLRFLIPEEFSGFGLNSRQYGETAILIAKSSGALNLLQAQHQRTMGYFKLFQFSDQYENIINKGTSFAYYNAAGHSKALTVIPAKGFQDSFRLTGVLPWVTGFNLLDQLFLSFRFDDKRYFALLPFRNNIENDGEMRCSDPIQLLALSSANNVRITLTNWLIKPEHIIKIRPIQESCSPFELSSPPFVFVACAQAALEHVKASEYFNRESVRRHLIALQGKLILFKEKVLEAGCGEGLISLRAQGYPIVRDALELARLVCGAKVLLPNHPIGRMSMEVQQSVITGPREEQLDAYLAS